METNNWNQHPGEQQQQNAYGWNYSSTETQVFDQNKVRSFMANTFGWMAAALAISGFFAWVFGTNLELFAKVFIAESGKLSILGWVVMFAPILFVLAISAGIQRFSVPVLIGLFVGYAAVNGMSLSFIFLTFTTSSIAAVFAIAGGMFAAMAIVGYTTKMDLTRIGSILMMALFGILIASLVNIFMGSSTLHYIISYAGVVIFCGLTAWDVQKLKNIGAETGYASEGAVRISLMGALNLYLDFINLFILLLRIFGDRK